MGGLVASYYESTNRAGPEVNAALELKTRRWEGMRALFKVEGWAFHKAIEIKDAYIDYKVAPQVHLQLGYNKKRLGLEYEQSRKNRLSPERSYLYRKMESLGIVGRQLNLRLLLKPQRGLELDVGVGADASQNVNALTRVAYGRNDWGLGVWGLVESHRINNGYLFTWATALSAWYISEQSRAVLELIGGLDSEESEMERLFFEGRRVYFVGPKLELGRRFELSERVQIEPFTQLTLALHDLEDSFYNTIEAVGGVNIRYRRTVTGLTISSQGETERVEPYDRTVRAPRFFAEVRFDF